MAELPSNGELDVIVESLSAYGWDGAAGAIEALRAEVERLKEACNQFSAAHAGLRDESILLREVLDAARKWHPRHVGNACLLCDAIARCDANRPRTARKPESSL